MFNPKWQGDAPPAYFGFFGANIFFFMENEKSWGGKRAGAGRKKGSGVKFYSFKAPQEVVDALESVEETKADFIIRSILAYAEKQNR